MTGGADRIGVRSVYLFCIASDKSFTYLTLCRCQGHRTDLDGDLSQLPRTQNFTEEAIEHYTVSELWDDFGIVLDIIVSICFFTTHF